MKTFISTLALVASASAFAQTDAATTTAGTTEPTPYVQSIYDECLLIAGKNSWEVLKLTEDQVARVTDLQARYKESAQVAKDQALADEKAAAKGKGKVKKEIVPVAVPPVQTGTATTMEPEQLEQGVAVVTYETENTFDEPIVAEDLDKESDVSAANPDEMVDLNYSPVDAELRSILTPEQLLIWERRCDNRTSMNP